VSDRRDDLERIVRQSAEGIAEPSTEERRRAAHTAAAAREPRARPALPDRRPWRPVRVRWAVAGAVLILLATALGFGVGAELTPAGSARTEQTGLGFLPAKGWTVLQSGTAGAAASARAVAANVRLDPADRADEAPLHTLQTLSRDGVVIEVELTTRGDPLTDRLFPLRTEPLRFADARLQSVVGEPIASERRLTRYRLRAGVGGYNVDTRIVFGGRPPSVSALEAADDQLARLVVAPDQVTIAVRPTVAVRFDPVRVYGSVANGKAGQKVTVQFRQCGLLPVQFRDSAEVTTSEGGGWTADADVPTTGVFRAVVGEDVSGEVQVQKRADVRLSPTRFGSYRVDLVATTTFWHRRVTVERFDRKSRRWIAVRKLLFEDAGGAGDYVWSSTKAFSLKLPKKTALRATVSLAQARPCYIAGVSNILTT
jgi:hypothetical protein